MNYLEESANRELAEQYGIRKELIGLYDICSEIPGFAERTNSFNAFAACLHGYLVVKKKYYPGWNDIDINQTLDMIIRAVLNFPDVMFDVGSIYRHYLGRVRDHKFLGPITLE